MILERIPGNRFSRVLPSWKGKTAVCVATGPSLTLEQAELVRHLPKVVVNDAYLMFPEAEVCYFADSKWYAWHKDRAEFKAFKGQKCAIAHGDDKQWPDEVHLLRNMGGEGLCKDPTGICTGSNSGHQCINVAALANPERILMLGYDCKRAKDGKKHFFGEHPDKTEPPYETIRIRYRSMLEPAKQMGIEIINVTPGSAIDYFPMKDLASVLADKTPALVSG